jgi:hypothetical protein
LIGDANNLLLAKTVGDVMAVKLDLPLGRSTGMNTHVGNLVGKSRLASLSSNILYDKEFIQLNLCDKIYLRFRAFFLGGT